jgi:glycosyltransferase involved in cell wall biosynthesis
VVCSRQAVGGVDAVAGEHLLAYDTREQLVEAVLGVLQSPALRATLAEAGRARVLANHSWAASMRRMDVLIASQFERRSAA